MPAALTGFASVFKGSRRVLGAISLAASFGFLTNGYTQETGPLSAIASSELYEDARIPDLAEYRVRVDDVIEFLFRLEKEIEEGGAYRLHAGDTLRLQSLTIAAMNLEFRVEPDGMVTLPQLGRVHAAGRTISELQDELAARGREVIREPDFVLTSVSLFSPLDEFQSSISGLQEHGELVYATRVSPDGTIQAPVIASLPVVGLTLNEIEREAKARFAQELDGVHVSVILRDRAASSVSVLGEVERPGRFTIERPTSVSAALAMAGGWLNGANLRNVVILRRDEQWQLMATNVDLKDSLNGKSLIHPHELWLRDGDTIIVPKTALRRFDDQVQLVFTNGLYKLLPFTASIQGIKTTNNAEVPAVVTPPPTEP